MADSVAKSIRSGAVCITGSYRKNNEDNYLAEKGGHFFLVADGMGGMSAPTSLAWETAACTRCEGRLFGSAQHAGRGLYRPR